VSSGLARTALPDRIWTGISRARLSVLIGELAAPWTSAEEDRLLARREHERLRAAGAGPDHDLPFTDRVIVTLVYLRFQLPHQALAGLPGVHRSTVSRAIGEIRPLLAARGFAVPAQPGVRLRTLADVFAYAAARGVILRLDGTEVQVRRPRAGKPGRRAFVSGKKKQNTKKAAVITDEKGRTLWAGAFRPGRMHDQTAVRTEGIADLFTRYPQARAKVDAGYRGLARQFPDQVQAPPLKPARTPHRNKPQPMRPSATSSHRNGSASSTQTPNSSSGAPSSDSPDDATNSMRPSWRSPGWSPTAPPNGNPRQSTRQASTSQR
jgi:Helix-turn-helix of DDE superfamily endonuclease/DDE superfamily endonuclease